MYGTVGRMKVTPGRMDELVAITEQGRERGSQIKGFIAGYLVKLDNDPNGAIMVAVFEDKTTYLANADDPEQDKDFRRLRDCLDADPEWNDGQISAL